MGMITNKPLKECAPGCALKKRLKVIQRWLIVSSNAVKVQYDFCLSALCENCSALIEERELWQWVIYLCTLVLFFFISTLEITRKFNAKVVSKVSGRLWQMSIDGVLRVTENLSIRKPEKLFVFDSNEIFTQVC